MRSSRICAPSPSASLFQRQWRVVAIVNISIGEVVHYERFACSKLIFICVWIAIVSMLCTMQELLSSKVHFIVRLTTIGALLYASVCVYRLIVKMRREGKGGLLSKRLCLCLCQRLLRNSPFLLPLSFSYLSAGGRVLLSPFSSLPSYLLFCSLFCHNNSSFQQLSSKFPSSKW